MLACPPTIDDKSTPTCTCTFQYVISGPMTNSPMTNCNRSCDQSSYA